MSALIGQFEDRYGELVKATTNQVKTSFHNMEDVAAQHMARLSTLVGKLLTSYQVRGRCTLIVTCRPNKQCSYTVIQNDELEEDAEVAALLSDKDFITAAVTASNDNHSAAIVKKGDDLETVEDKRATDMIQRLRETEYERNRQRVTEIFDFVEQHQQLIHSKLAGAGASDEDLSSRAW